MTISPSSLAPILLLALAACADREAPPTSAPTAAELVGLDVGGVPVRVRLAATSAQRARGLAGVASLAPDEGMLFLYPDARPRQFWTQGCLIALDVAFLDAAGTVLHVDTLQPPGRGGEMPRSRRSAPSTDVLEVPAGFFAPHDLGAGPQVTLPERVHRVPAK